MMKHAWLTPDVDQLNETLEARTICVPGSLWYLVSGALELLAEDYNWEDFGTASVEQTADFFRAVRDEYIMSGFSEVGKVQAFITQDVPDKWIEMMGQFLPPGSYPELTSVVPVEWVQRGGVLLPDMRLTGISGYGVYDGVDVGVGGLGGANYRHITVQQLPSHTHSYGASTGSMVVVNGELSPETVSVNFADGRSTGSTGGNEQLPMKSRYLAVRWCIYAGR